ncbi:MAG: hypothetical protein ACTSRZ_13255, partial [Promethearchaeota archaeon]
MKERIPEAYKKSYKEFMKKTKFSFILHFVKYLGGTLKLLTKHYFSNIDEKNDKLLKFITDLKDKLRSSNKTRRAVVDLYRLYFEILFLLACYNTNPMTVEIRKKLKVPIDPVLNILKYSIYKGENENKKRWPAIKAITCAKLMHFYDSHSLYLKEANYNILYSGFESRSITIKKNKFVLDKHSAFREESSSGGKCKIEILPPLEVVEELRDFLYWLNETDRQQAYFGIKRVFKRLLANRISNIYKLQRVVLNYYIDKYYPRLVD